MTVEQTLLLLTTRARLADHGLSMTIERLRNGWTWYCPEEGHLHVRREFETVGKAVEHASHYTEIWYK